MNYQNWDADNVYITKLAQTYNAESSTLAPAMVLRGEIDYADIPTSMLDEWLQSYPEYLSKDRAVPDYSYFYCFNFRAGSGSPRPHLHLGSQRLGARQLGFGREQRQLPPRHHERL